jgi:hypothetical protein
MIPYKLKGPNVIERNVKAGDTWRGFTVRGDVPDVPPLVKVTLQFRTLDKRFVYELSSEHGSENGLPAGWPNNGKGNITIIDPALWVFSVDSQPLPMAGGTYLWELETLDEMNTTRSLLNGRIVLCEDGVR